MEWLWSVDDMDEALGRVERADAHARTVCHRAGVVLLRDSRKRVFLTHRAASKLIFPNTYDTSASFHVAYGESYKDAARREALEELGLSNALECIGKFCHLDPPEHQFVMVFTMDHRGEQIVLDPQEATAGRFYTRSEAERIALTAQCTPWLPRALRLLSEGGAW